MSRVLSNHLMWRSCTETAQEKVVKLFGAPFELIKGLMQHLFQNIHAVGEEESNPIGMEGEKDLSVYRSIGFIFNVIYSLYLHSFSCTGLNFHL